MHKIILTLILIFIGSLTAQQVEDMNVPCKPLSEHAKRYGMLSKPLQSAAHTDYDVTYYDIGLMIDISRENIKGSTEIHLLPKVDGLMTIQLDLTANMVIDSVYIDAMSYFRSGDILYVNLNRPFIQGKKARVGIAYRGRPEGGGFKGFSFGSQPGSNGSIPIVSTLSEPYGARTWWPCKDVPTDKADSVRISITADEALTAVSNGILTSVTPTENGMKKWVWEHKYPITTYLVSIVVTEFSYWNDTFHFADGDSMPLEYWVFPNKYSQTLVDRWNRTSLMMEIFNEAYGKYPFSEEKYGMAHFDWGGAMEHQTCSSMGSESGSGENTMAHELAHQWWGDLVTCENFHHIWINEGFATYSEALYWGAKNGDAAYHAHMRGKAGSYISSGSIYRNDTTSVGGIFDYIVYGKGAWVLHMLRHVVGDDDFFEIFSQFRESYKFSHASTEDFQSVAESVHGEGLDWFFDQWIYGTGRPDYLWSWHVRDSDGAGNWEISVNVKQTQFKVASSFKMPIDFKFWNGTNDTTVVLFNSLLSENFTVNLDFEPTDAALDPEGWILKTVAESLDVEDTFLPEKFALLDAYPNPFNSMVTIPFAAIEAFSGMLEIYDLSGNLQYVKALEIQVPGFYEHIWDAKDSEGNSMPTGVYVTRIISSNAVSVSKKISLLK